LPVYALSITSDIKTVQVTHLVMIFSCGSKVQEKINVDISLTSWLQL
jgi:hypothetical protein